MAMPCGPGPTVIRRSGLSVATTIGVMLCPIVPIAPASVTYTIFPLGVTAIPAGPALGPS